VRTSPNRSADGWANPHPLRTPLVVKSAISARQGVVDLTWWKVFNDPTLDHLARRRERRQKRGGHQEPGRPTKLVTEVF